MRTKIRMRVAENEQLSAENERYMESRYVDAERLLGVGALGVGESHTDHRPREFVQGLIKRGLVWDLFLECDSDDQKAFNKAVAVARHSADPLDHELIKDLVDRSGPRPYPNEVDLGDVVETALQRGVRVHFIDRYLRSSTSPGKPAIRDAHAAKLFAEITETRGTVGCLLLFGAAHFIGGTDTYRGGEPCLGKLLKLNYMVFG